MNTFPGARPVWFVQSFVVLVWLITVPPVQAEENTLVFSAIEGSVNSDISMAILREAYAQLGIEVRMLPLPGERALRTVNSGKVDGEVFRIANVEKRYTNLVPIPTSINVLQAIVFSKKHDFTVNGWDSLKRYRIGIQVGIKFAERGTKGMRRTMVDTNEQLFRLLDADRVDIAVAAYANGLKTLNEIKLPEIRSLRPPIQEYPLFHYLHKKHAGLVPKLDNILIKMKESGRLTEIRESFLRKYK